MHYLVVYFMCTILTQCELQIREPTQSGYTDWQAVQPTFGKDGRYYVRVPGLRGHAAWGGGDKIRVTLARLVALVCHTEALLTLMNDRVVLSLFEVDHVNGERVADACAPAQVLFKY